MGVKGLWQLLDSAGKPIPLERLENRVLAIDVSIWLNQSLAGFRDASGGGVVSQAHLLGLFHRVCKLLFYRIKPVFVFDGKPPQLKKELLAKRRMKKAGAGKKADKTRSKIVENYLKQQIVAKQLQRQTQQVSKALEGGQEGLANLLSHRKGNSAAEKDLFELPTPKVKDEDDFSDEEERDDVLGRLDIDHSTDIHAVDLGSSGFKTLTSSQKYEVLLELREKRKQSSWAKLGEMPQEARSFSGYQMERLRKRRRIQKMTDEVGTELTDDSLAVADSKLFVGDREGMRKERKRIVGKDFVYLEGIRDKNLTDYEQNLANTVESEDGVTQEELLALASKQEDASLDIVEPSTSFQSSSRRGGVKLLEEDSEDEDDPRPSTSGGKPADVAKSAPLQGVQIDMSVVTQTAFNEKDDIFADVFEPKSAIERNASSSSSSTTSDFVSSDDDGAEKIGEEKGEEKDMFADVFSNAADVQKLDKILKGDEADGKAEKNTDRNRVLGAAAAAESIEEMFANVSKKTRKFEDSGVPDESRAMPSKRAKTQEHDIASTMKESSHLFLKIKSKWVEEREGPSVENKEASKNEARSLVAEGDDRADEMSRMLEKENKALVSEMRRMQGEERLLKIKQSLSTTKTFPKVMSKSGTVGTSQSAEEMGILRSMNVEAQSVESYTKSIIGIGEEKSKERGVDEEVSVENAEEGEESVVYGSSAPGFVRGSRTSNIVEVDKNEIATAIEEVTPLDESIANKLDNTEEDADVLTEDELRAIQERLARDTSALIAERGKHDRVAATVSDQMYADCQELLQMFGIPWVVAPSEAEAQCAFFDLIGMTDGSVTDDSDVWLFGGQNVLKVQLHGHAEYTVYMNFFNQDKHCESFTAAEIGRHFGLSREKMILMALLTGSDYTEGITDVGPVTAMEILAEFPGTGIAPLNEFKGWWEDQQALSGKVPVGSKTREKFRKFQLPNSFPNQKVIDAYLYPTVDNSTEGFSWAVPNFVEIRDFAQERFGWTRQKVDELIKPVIKRFDTKVTQSKIDKFFQSDRLELPSKGKGLIQNSKRVQEAVERVLGKKQSSDVKTSEKKREPKKSNQRTAAKAEAQETTRKKPLLTPAEAEEKRKAEAKAKAAQVWKTVGGGVGAKPKRKGARKRPVRKVMSQHNLSESESD